jgi:diaminopimelate decarboxylase
LKFLEASEVRGLAEQYGTPLFVYDLRTIKKNYEYFSKTPTPYGLTVRYSVKANPTRAILAYFDQLGASFDVSSVWEAHRCVNAGIDAKRVLLTAQAVSPGWEALCEAGMEFDAGSLLQLKTYGEKFPSTSVSLRINPGFGSGLVKKLTSGGKHSSFGLWFAQLDEAVALAECYCLTIKRIHLHIGSGHDSEVLEKTVTRALELCAKVPSVTHLNLGGGYKVTALNSDPHYDHHAVGARIGRSLEQFQSETGRKLHLEVEPGTFSMALAGSLITRVIDVVNTGVDGYRLIKIDGGLTEIMRPSFYGALHPLVVVKHNGTLDKHEVCKQMVCGHCCIAGDSLTPMAGNTDDFTPMLLARAKPNDFLVVERTGAYAASMSVKNFNSYPEAAEVCRVGKDNYHLVRKRQTLEQMTQNERDLLLM